MKKETMVGKCRWVNYLTESDYAVFYRKGTNHDIPLPPIALDPKRNIHGIRIKVSPVGRKSDQNNQNKEGK